MKGKEFEKLKRIARGLQYVPDGSTQRKHNEALEELLNWIFDLDLKKEAQP